MNRLPRSILLLAAVIAAACLPDTTKVNTPVGIRFVAQPGNTRANTLMSAVSVGFINSDGAVTRGSAGGQVDVTLVTTDTSVHLLGATTADGAFGIAIFDGLSVNKPATNLKLVAKSAGFDSTVSAPFSITP